MGISIAILPQYAHHCIKLSIYKSSIKVNLENIDARLLDEFHAHCS